MGFYRFFLAIGSIPILFELIPTIFYSLRFLFKKEEIEEKKESWLPHITVIVPIYNSEKTLIQCIESISNSTYPTHLMQIICINNGSVDDSYSTFMMARQQFDKLNLQWIDCNNGKSLALNIALYNSYGEYIIQIDSDGILDSLAIEKMINKFIHNSGIKAMAGTILTQRELIKADKNFFSRFLKKQEYFEYANSFLLGRRIESASGRIFTMAGAFCGYRKEAIKETFLFDTEVVGEDIDMTFQLKKRLNYNVDICSEAVFYVEPIDGLNALYKQRQRWQRGELEVAHKYVKKEAKLRNILKDFMISRLILDHTFSFLRIMWAFILMMLLIYGYRLQVIMSLIGGLYVLNVLNVFICYFTTLSFMRGFKDDHRFFKKLFGIVIFAPVYQSIVFIFRFIGILNSINRPTQWNSLTIKEELLEIVSMVKEDIKRIYTFLFGKLLNKKNKSNKLT